MACPFPLEPKPRSESAASSTSMHDSVRAIRLLPSPIPLRPYPAAAQEAAAAAAAAAASGSLLAEPAPAATNPTAPATNPRAKAGGLLPDDVAAGLSPRGARSTRNLMFRRLGKRICIPLAGAGGDEDYGLCGGSPLAGSPYWGEIGSPVGTPLPPQSERPAPSPTQGYNPATSSAGAAVAVPPSALSPFSSKSLRRSPLRAKCLSPHVASPLQPGTWREAPMPSPQAVADDMASLEKHFGELAATADDEFHYDEESLANDATVTAAVAAGAADFATPHPFSPAAEPMGETAVWANTLLSHQIIPTPTALGCLLSLGVPEQHISIDDAIHGEGEDASDLSDEDTKVISKLLTAPTPHPISSHLRDVTSATTGNKKRMNKRPLHFIYGCGDEEEEDDEQEGRPACLSSPWSDSDSSSASGDEDEIRSTALGIAITRQRRQALGQRAGQRRRLWHPSPALSVPPASAKPPAARTGPATFPVLSPFSAVSLGAGTPTTTALTEFTLGCSMGMNDQHQQQKALVSLLPEVLHPDPLAGALYMSSLGPSRGDFL